MEIAPWWIPTRYTVHGTRYSVHDTRYTIHSTRALLGVKLKVKERSCDVWRSGRRPLGECRVLEPRARLEGFSDLHTLRMDAH
jgi:hypothetical protein